MGGPPLPAELRLALCMRGGVSLAVWMGGACREIAAVRAAKSCPTPAGPVEQRDQAQRLLYQRILELAGYDEVTIDVIAGTSAGGLNGALLTSHLVYGMPFDNNIRDVWLRLGDLESLTRHPGRGTPSSLLAGDEGFHEKLAGQLRTLVSESAPDPSCPDDSPRLVRLILTATRLRPRNEYLRPSVGAPLLASWSQAQLTFRHLVTEDGQVHPVFTDFSDRDRPDEHLDRLSYAARTTSSFPVAFEPALLTVTRPERGEQDRWRNMFGLCSETGVPDDGRRTVSLVDGGVLDNIPLSWAIRAVASASAKAPVDRWLLYLQPVPMRPRAATTENGSLTRLLGVVGSLFSVKFTSESLLDDARGLSEAWTTAQRLHGAAGGLPGNPAYADLPDEDACGRLLSRYANSLACLEADRLIRLIEDPNSLVGPDPLPIPDSQRFTNSQAEVPVLEVLRGRTFPEIVVHDENTWEGPATFRSPMAPARAVALALDWVQSVEDDEDGLTSRERTAVKTVRASLYQARFACEVLLASRDRLLLRAEHPSSVLAWVRTATVQLDQFLRDAGGLAGEDRGWSAVLAGLAGHAVEAPLSDAPRGWPAGLYEPIWHRVGEMCARFRQDVGDKANTPGFRALYEAAEVPLRAVSVLAVAELLLGPLRPDPLSEPSRIHFHAMSAATRSPLERMLIGSNPPADDAERVERKLSGNKLMNFASFLSCRWRLNDWTWGRLDAACSLVDVITRSERLRQWTDDELVTWLHDLHRDLSGDDVFGDTTADIEDHTWLAELIGPWERLHVDNANVRHRLPELLTAWLHWNILRQEIPTLLGLNGLRGDERDAPPSAERLAAANRTPITRLSTQSGTLGGVGQESVHGLLTKSHLRRAGLRLGLVAWRALRPSKGWLLRAVLALLKPLLVLPLLIGFLTPTWTLAIAGLTWLGVTVATEQWFSLPGHLIVAFGAISGQAASYAFLHFFGRKEKARYTRVLSWHCSAFLVLLALGWFNRDALALLPGTGWVRGLLVGGLTTAALLMSLWGIAAWRIRPGRLRRLLFMTGTCLLPTAAAVLLTGTIGGWTDWQPLGGWWAAGILYITVAVDTLLLTYLFPAPPTEPSPAGRGTSRSRPGQMGGDVGPRPPQ